MFGDLHSAVPHHRQGIRETPLDHFELGYPGPTASTACSRSPMAACAELPNSWQQGDGFHELLLTNVRITGVAHVPLLQEETPSILRLQVSLVHKWKDKSSSGSRRCFLGRATFCTRQGISILNLSDIVGLGRVCESACSFWNTLKLAAFAAECSPLSRSWTSADIRRRSLVAQAG